MSFEFKIEQVAISVNPNRRAEAFALLERLGLKTWAHDEVTAIGSVDSDLHQTSLGQLAFNYEAGDIGGKPVEFEVLHYKEGDNFVDRAKNHYGTDAIATHLGMHCTAEALQEVRGIFASFGIPTSQEVRTVNHTNPHIKDSRRYVYAIFATRDLLGIDLKFIVRLPYTPEEGSGATD